MFSNHLTSEKREPRRSQRDAESGEVTAQLAPGDDKNKRFWYIFRGVEGLPLEFSGVRLPDSARLKLYKLEDYTAQTLEEFNLCDTKKPGMLYQVTVAAHSEKHTFLESCVRAYLDGAEEPILLSSGLEDYCGSWLRSRRGRAGRRQAGRGRGKGSVNGWQTFGTSSRAVQFWLTLTRRKIRSSGSLVVVVTVVVVPPVTGTIVTFGPPAGPLPLSCQSMRLDDHW